MSYVALATDEFDRAVRFYQGSLGFPTVSAWDRPNGRGCRLDAGGGLRLEILDNARQRRPAALGSPSGRVHVVVEVDDIQAARSRLRLDAPSVETTSWGAELFQLDAPDGECVTFLRWVGDHPEQP